MPRSGKVNPKNKKSSGKIRSPAQQRKSLHRVVLFKGRAARSVAGFSLAVAHGVDFDAACLTGVIAVIMAVFHSAFNGIFVFGWFHDSFLLPEV
jgi:hypothetical protein